jgi:hypothetical protein
MRWKPWFQGGCLCHPLLGARAPEHPIASEQEEERPMSELPTPPDAAGDPSAMEVLRAWLIGDALHCSLRANVFEDPALWGAVLADFARYVARGLEQSEGIDPDATLRAIREVFAEELTTSSQEESEETPPPAGAAGASPP